MYTCTLSISVCVHDLDLFWDVRMMSYVYSIFLVNRKHTILGSGRLLLPGPVVGESNWGFLNNHSPVQLLFITIIIYGDIIKYNEYSRFNKHRFVLKWCYIKLRPTLKCCGGIQALPTFDTTSVKQTVHKRCRLCFLALNFPIHFNAVSSLNSLKFNHV